ncbi:putative TonB-dependent receptor precursor, partial [Haemophilus influenzae]|jgi:hypothetical protein
MKS